ncbi:FtsB family cell division protein [Parvularcula sp. LCG005]|uniref:FtsB family cell division protein n=1 Tax=Parvularcula sp. LCG005 TaxID=3078805 RepID=UPI0029427AA5|nr:septum formation initiator family protein [Parvularcula sp. LCG005]WOI54218.1 septum formation initiator family protein [Parvularcula sp. LCG005]
MTGFLKQVADAVLPAICVVGIGYNGLLYLNAPEGVRMNNLLQDRIADSRAELAALEAERQRLSDHADRLLTASLDEDLLEERVRSVLGLVRPNEYMVRMEDLDRLAAAPADMPAPLLNEDAPVTLAALASLDTAR